MNLRTTTEGISRITLSVVVVLLYLLSLIVPYSSAFFEKGELKSEVRHQAEQLDLAVSLFTSPAEYFVLPPLQSGHSSAPVLLRLPDIYRICILVSNKGWTEVFPPDSGGVPIPSDPSIVIALRKLII